MRSLQVNEMIDRRMRALGIGFFMPFLFGEPLQGQPTPEVVELFNRRPKVPVPSVPGKWWRIAGNPDLGELGSEKQEPVDFAIWKAADGTWQLLSCIRHTNCGGETRLFYRWESRSLTSENWKPKGVAMQADPKLGETAGGLQAPHVFKRGREYYMVYGDWQRICLARSLDGKNFERVLNERGQPDLFRGPYGHTRDPMVIELGGLYVCYYTGHEKDEKIQAAVFCRTSADLVHWSEPMLVAAGGEAHKHSWYGGDCECPFVLNHEGHYYLFRNLLYGKGHLNVQYASTNPFDFGVGTDRCYVGLLRVAAPEIIVDKRRQYIASLTPELDGIRLARLQWVKP